MGFDLREKIRGPGHPEMTTACVYHRSVSAFLCHPLPHPYSMTLVPMENAHAMTHPHVHIYTRVCGFGKGVDHRAFFISVVWIFICDLEV